MKAGVTIKQVALLCSFFEENPEVIKGYLKTSAGISAVQTKWKKITPQLNSLGEERYHKAWAKYLCNVKAKLKRKHIKWRQNSDGTGPIICNAEDFSELELRMLLVLRKNTEAISQDFTTSDVENNVKEDDKSDSDMAESSWHERIIAEDKSRADTHIKLSDNSLILETQPHNYNNHKVDDEFDTFGKNVAQQLRTLSLPVALETQEMLLAVLRKQRLKVPSKFNSINLGRHS